MLLAPVDQELVLLWRILWSFCFQKGSKGASMKVEVGLSGKMKQIWKKLARSLLQELSSLFQTCRCCLALEDVRTVAVRCG